jgi:hypothetical protein
MVCHVFGLATATVQRVNFSLTNNAMIQCYLRPLSSRSLSFLLMPPFGKFSCT